MAIEVLLHSSSNSSIIRLLAGPLLEQFGILDDLKQKYRICSQVAKLKVTSLLHK